MSASSFSLSFPKIYLPQQRKPCHCVGNRTMPGKVLQLYRRRSKSESKHRSGEANFIGQNSKKKTYRPVKAAASFSFDVRSVTGDVCNRQHFIIVKLIRLPPWASCWNLWIRNWTDIVTSVSDGPDSRSDQQRANAFWLSNREGREKCVFSLLAWVVQKKGRPNISSNTVPFQIVQQ